MQQRVQGPAMILVLAVTAAFPAAATAAEIEASAAPAPQLSAPGLFDEAQLRGEPVLQQASQHWQAGHFDQVLALIRPLAESENPVGQFVLGGLYSQGQGVPQDEEQAAQWWRKAAEQGLARAQNELAVMLSDGRGVPADPQQAVTWYRKAAEQGLAAAQANLGLMYWRGLGVSRNDRQAVAWFRKAAEQGFGWAQFYLGNAYAQGRGVARDQKQAVDWIRRSAEQGYTEAQNALGTLYFRGAGIARNLGSAAWWFSQAAQNGLEAAEQNLLAMLPALQIRRLRTVTEVREKPDAAATVIRTATEREYAYELVRKQGWVEIYLLRGHTVGYVRAAELRNN